MVEYSIFTICTKNYRDAYEFTIDSWLRTSAEEIYIYTDDSTWKSNNDRIKIKKIFEPSKDWLTNVGRKSLVGQATRKISTECLLFLDIDCYLVNDLGYIFDEHDFDFAVTRFDEGRRRPPISSGIYFFHNTERNRKFFDDWAVDQKKVYKLGRGRTTYGCSYSQISFSNLLKKYSHQKKYKVINLDVLRYNRKTGKPHQKTSVIGGLKRKEIEVLHFYARTWRSKDSAEILSHLEVAK